MENENDGNIVDRRYEIDKSAHRRNWLMVWRMEDNGIDMNDLAKLTGIPVQHLNKFMLTPEQERITRHCERICKALTCQPRDIGWGLKFDKLDTPYRLDIHACRKLAQIQIAGHLQAAKLLQNIQDDMDRILKLYVDDSF